MKQPSTNSARLEFASPEINVGIAAAKTRKKSPTMAKEKNLIMVKKSKPAMNAAKIGVMAKIKSKKNK
jgi:hypothetical protein